MKLITGLVVVVVVLLSADVQAATLLVSNTNDSGAGSLRQAVINNNTAGGGNTIVFSNAVTGAITLTGGELLIMSNVAILGPGPGSLAVSGNAASRIFHITNAVTAVISGLTITNGIPTGNYPTYGIWNDHSTLTLSNCAISGNLGGGIINDGSSGTATLSIFASTVNGNSTYAGGNGGAIINEGDAGNAILTVVASTFSSNTVVGTSTVGGAIFNHGNSGGTTVSISNCTFSANSAGEDGGAIFNAGVSGISPTVLTVMASTFCSNSALAGSLSGGAILNIGASATLILGDTILKAGAAGGTIANSGGFITSAGYNLSSDSANGLLKSSTDQTNIEPMLGPLANNGGPTFTHALLPGSPAIDKGKSFGLGTDQRGFPRPYDFVSVTNASGGDGSDVGAFELGRPTVSIQQIGSSALLSWPSYYTNYTLQSSTNIASSNSWTTAGGGAAVVGSQYQQTNGPISSNRFFRLRGN